MITGFKFGEEKGKSQLKGLSEVKARILYLVKEKYDYKNLGVKQDAHKGNHFMSTNIEIDMLTPHEMLERGELQTKSKYDAYVDEFAEELAKQFVNLSHGEWDLGSFIISLAPQEAAYFKKEEELSDFLLMLHDEFMMAMSNCSKIEDVNFKHLGVPHLKETNPHAHSNINSKTFDGHKVDFHRGNSNYGLIKLFNDKKFELEARYPHILLPMEHEKRAKQLKVKLENQELKADGADGELLESLKTLKAKYSGANYYHKDFKKEFTALGFKTQFQKKPKEVLVSFKDGDFKSLKNLDFEFKRLIEKYDELEHAHEKTGTDISKIIFDATKFINSSNLNLEDLNKELKEKFNVMISPAEIERHKTSGEYLYKKWSIHLIDEGLKFSALKYGIQLYKITITLAMVKKMQEEIQTLDNERKQKINCRGYEKKNKREMTTVHMLDGETFEEYKERQAKENMKSALLLLEKVGNDMFGTNHRKMMSLLSPSEIAVYRGGERAAVQMYIAKGFKSITFTGEANKEIQARMYIEAALHGVKVSNYTPDAETKAIADKGLNSVYSKLIGTNIAMIDKKIEEMKAAPNDVHKQIYLKTNYKFEIEIDARPKLYGYLYGVYNGLKPEAFAHMEQALKDTPRDVLKSVIDDFQLSETLTDENLAIILADCHINLNEPTTPVYTLPKAHNPESGPKPTSQQAPGAEEAKPAKPTEPTPAQPKPQPEQEPKPVVTYPTGTNPTQQNGTQTQAQQQAQEDKQKQEQERDKALGREALKKLKEKL